MNDVMERVRAGKLIAIVRGLSGEYMAGIAQALIDGGITMMEVTFDQAKPESWADTCSAISMLCEKIFR